MITPDLAAQVIATTLRNGAQRSESLDESLAKFNLRNNAALVADAEAGLSKINPATRVFHIPGLLDRILSYLLSDKNQQVVTANVKCIRSVNKSWLRSTTRLLVFDGKPLFYFYPLPAQYPQPIEGAHLRQFTASAPKTLHERIPLHFLKCSSTLFINENHAFFLEYFRTCGEGLLQLELACNKCEYPKPLDMNMSLPNLQKFRLHQDHILLADLSIGPQNCITAFIQSVLNASPQLKSFEFSWNCLPLPANFENLTFPTKPAEWDLTCGLADYNMEILLKSSLSNLKTLKLFVPDTPFQGELFTQVLKKVGKTVESVHVTQSSSGKFEPEHTTEFQLPLMEKMKTLEITTPYLLLDNNDEFLERFVPQMNSLTLENQSIPDFLPWTEKSCFPLVDCLKLSLPSPQEWWDGGPLTLSTMEALKRTFPNVHQLDIFMFDAEMNMLAFIIKEMKTLTHLKINSFGAYTNETVKPEFLDALLIGISGNSLVALKESPGLWDELKDQSTVSIRNLTELHTLELTFNVFCNTLFDTSSAFRFAFFMMPNLTNLIFRGHFSVPAEIKQEWCETGRTIEMYHAN